MVCCARVMMGRCQSGEQGLMELDRATVTSRTDEDR